MKDLIKTVWDALTRPFTEDEKRELFAYQDGETSL